MTPAGLLLEAQTHGVTLTVTGGRLLASPGHRVPPDLRDRLILHRAAVVRLLAAAAPPADDPDIVRLAEWIERRYRRAAEVRRRHATGWPGSAERDARYFAARHRRGAP
jgi:hypothetical protein